MFKQNHTKAKLYGLALITLTLTGCSTLESLKDGAQSLYSSVLGIENSSEPPAALVEYQPEIAIDVLWKERVGAGKNNQNLKLDIAVNSGRLFVADRNGLVQARMADTGQLLWEADIEQPLSAGPGVGSDTLVVGGSNANVTALNISTGEKLWSTTVSSEVSAVPVISNGIVIIRTTDGEVTALNEKNGKRVWAFDEAPPALTLRGSGKPLILKDRVIVGFANGKMMALQLANGKTAWDTTVAMPSGRSEVERLVDLVADPLERDGILFVSSYRGGTSAVLASDGNMLWRNEQLSSAVGLTADWRYLYTSDINSDVWQIEPRNGSTLWKQQELHFRSLSTPESYQEYVVVGDYEGYLHWLSRSDGRQLGRIQISDAGIDGKPLAIDDVIYVYAKDGTLAAVKAKAL